MFFFSYCWLWCILREVHFATCVSTKQTMPRLKTQWRPLLIFHGPETFSKNTLPSFRQKLKDCWPSWQNALNDMGEGGVKSAGLAENTMSAGTIRSKRAVLFLWPVNLTLFQTQANRFIGQHRGRFSRGRVFIASFPSLVLKHKTLSLTHTHIHTHSCEGHCPHCHINICRA